VQGTQNDSVLDIFHCQETLVIPCRIGTILQCIGMDCSVRALCGLATCIAVKNFRYDLHYPERGYSVLDRIWQMPLSSAQPLYCLVTSFRMAVKNLRYKWEYPGMVRNTVQCTGQSYIVPDTWHCHCQMPSPYASTCSHLLSHGGEESLVDITGLQGTGQNYSVPGRWHCLEPIPCEVLSPPVAWRWRILAG
jgi:hypothetical protein